MSAGVGAGVAPTGVGAAVPVVGALVPGPGEGAGVLTEEGAGVLGLSVPASKNKM